MKKLNKLSLSLVVGSLLFTQSYALPSGGKFTHGTSGTININDKVMNIAGKGQNSVIQWGGGFNIASGETVNFGQGKTNQNYLNIVYGSKSSHIDGKLEGGSNNIFLINPNGIVVGKGGSISANRVYLSTSSVGDDGMQKFANGASDTDAIFGTGKNISPVIQLNPKGNIINLGTIEGKNDLTLIGNEIAQFDKDKNVGLYKSNNRISFRYNTNYVIMSAIESPGIEGPITSGMSAASVDQFVSQGKIVSETSNLIISTDIDANVINSIFDSLKFNSYTSIDNLATIYKENGELLSEDVLQSIDFMTALYGQASANENAKLKEALSTSYENVEKAGKSINTVKNTLAQISKTTEQQKNTQKAYDDALNNYNTIVELYNKALQIGDSKVLETLKTEMDSKYIVLQQATTALKDATSSNNSNLETNKQTIASASIDNYKLTVHGEYLADYKTVNKPNDNNSGSNNGNDGTDSGDINNGNNNGSNNNPNDTIGQQEPDIATALLMQTTDEDPNINEDDKQASIDEASTQESGNACIVSDNFKAGNPCSR
ncbi:filamentous hemagglutinin N-terminal domain-containing protein [Campylobacter sp. US42a]|uniref:two-partner secretion domain-containing protein n=1 Tax=Campylobacter sp. US42a TaxID=2498121 RepID=UPI001067991A|nr:filamentous hemagglutinin N-terminal domain-containing protein [Campylobacter sp. US42a]ELJ6944059.1 filamentous hemagglutinin N-terminal domain-containing protein [Campylobacter jejuni]TEX97503.1 filamentous hemagglutinin N-terminal domain-containing protein [Campylobacter sp. US42a]HEC1688470.1 filamentous hemagglutinin N-terminal domain-containing protein [Campylobacter jejuni]HEC1761687.1 filamentous hemagglutinin N-terminal domain-containing protein [Campylobacter jejuni]